MVATEAQLERKSKTTTESDLEATTPRGSERATEVELEREAETAWETTHRMISEA